MWVPGRGGGVKELTGAGMCDHPREGSVIGSLSLDYRAHSEVIVQVEAQGPVVPYWALCYLGCLKLTYHLQTITHEIASQ